MALAGRGEAGALKLGDGRAGDRPVWGGRGSDIERSNGCSLMGAERGEEQGDRVSKRGKRRRRDIDASTEGGEQRLSRWLDYRAIAEIREGVNAERLSFSPTGQVRLLRWSARPGTWPCSRGAGAG